MRRDSVVRMKTLDEVIDELEDEGLFADALHYLKEYQGYLLGKEISETFDEAFAEMYNPPLTWDELRQMEGKPVWVEQMESGKAYGKWLLVQTPPCLGDVYMVSRYRERIMLYEPEMGKTWQAYGKERNELTF